MTTDNFCFYFQNRLIQTSQTGGQQYSDTSPFSIPWFVCVRVCVCTCACVCVCVCATSTSYIINKPSYLKLENSAQTTFRCSPVSCHAPQVIRYGIISTVLKGSGGNRTTYSFFKSKGFQSGKEELSNKKFYRNGPSEGKSFNRDVSASVNEPLFESKLSCSGRLIGGLEPTL
jgi:hypothetical protein